MNKKTYIEPSAKVVKIQLAAFLANSITGTNESTLGVGGSTGQSVITSANSSDWFDGDDSEDW